MALLTRYLQQSLPVKHENTGFNLVEEELKLLSAIDINSDYNEADDDDDDGKLFSENNDEEMLLDKESIKLEIISQCDYLARLVVENRLGTRCKIGERHRNVWKYLMRGIELYVNNGGHLLEGKARQLWISNKCEYSTFYSIAKELILKPISWIQICGLFALLDRLAAFCKMFGRSYIAKLAAVHLSTFILDSKILIEFLEENGGWVNIFEKKLMVQDIEELKKNLYISSVQIVALGLICLWRYW